MDGCGGFLVLKGPVVRVGRADTGTDLDLSILADMPRMAGEIRRDDGEYYWQDASPEEDEMDWISNDQPIAGLGAARLSLVKPSPLCESATLTLGPPHRFGEHVDGALLVTETWLIGPTADCHVRCRSAEGVIVMVWKESRWWAKAGFNGELTPVLIGDPITVEGVSMTLEGAMRSSKG